MVGNAADSIAADADVPSADADFYDHPSRVRRVRARKIDAPAPLFDGWVFEVSEHHWGLFGVSFRQFMKDKQPYMSWAVDEPARYDFLEGSIFYAGPFFLQVAFCGGDGFVEVHEGRVGQDADTAVIWRDGAAALAAAFGVKRAGWLVREVEFAEWLRTGVRPDAAVSVDRAHSSCTGLLALALPTAD